MRDRVVVHDLRGTDGPTALGRTRDLLDLEGDLTHVLLVDDAASVLAHWESFAALLTAHRVRRHLCVVTGLQDGREGLTLPGTLDRATLWVPDTSGIDWPYRASAVAKHHPGAAPGSGLARLLDLLQVPEIFRRMGELLEHIPWGAACPALRPADAGDSGADGFQVALRIALAGMLDENGADTALPVTGDGLPGRPAGAAPAKLTPGGPLALAEEAAREALEDASHAVAALDGATAPLLMRRPDPDAVSRSAHALAHLRDMIGSLLRDVPLHPEPGRLISRRGLELPHTADLSVDQVTRTLDRSLRGWLLESGASLPLVGESLRQWADRLNAAVAHGAELRRALPDELIEGLRVPSPFPGPQRWLLLVGATVSALVGLTPAGIAGGMAMAVLWTALVLLTVVRAPGTTAADHSAALAGNAVAGLAGAIAGGLAGADGAGLLGTAGPPALVWPAVLVTACGGALTAVLVSWRHRCAAWDLAVLLARAVHCLDALMALLGRAAAEWAWMHGKAATLDTLNQCRLALDGVQETLAGHARELDRDWRGGMGRGFQATVRRRLADLVLAALRPALEQPADGKSDTGAHRRAAALRAADLLAGWRAHVDEHGPSEPPEFASDQGHVSALESDADLDRRIRATGYDPAGVMWQLCRPADLPLLDVPPGRPLAVPYAPKAGRAAFHGTVPTDTVWLTGDAYCGVLRLVPFRPQVIAWSWTHETSPAGGAVDGMDGSQPDGGVW